MNAPVDKLLFQSRPAWTSALQLDARFAGGTPAPSGTEAFQQHTGRIRRREDGAFEVDDGGCWLPVSRAASCLLQPGDGDLVVWGAGGDRAWVLHVLERASTVAAEVALPSRAVLTTEDDSEMTLRASALKVQAPRLDIDSDELTVTARAGRFVSDTCLSVVRTLEAAWSQVRVVGDHWNAVFDRFHSHAREHSRTTQELDLVQAGSLDMRARDLASVHAEHVAVDGERLVKMRGGQIHMG